MPDLPPQNVETYLGDGLYASFDGWQILLRAPRPHPTNNDATQDHVVALEPDVYRSLQRWIRRYPSLAAHVGAR